MSICLGILLLVACEKRNGMGKYEGLEYFMMQDAAGLYVDNDPIFIYDESSCQIACNEARKMVRFQRDDQSNYVNMVFSTLELYNAQIVNVAINYKTDMDKRNTMLEMTIVKSDEHKCWLWCEKGKTGIILFK